MADNDQATLKGTLISHDFCILDEQAQAVAEWCPHCETEIEMEWDTNTRGFSAFCPVCGQPLMLCDECRHTENARACDYDAGSGTCWNRRAAKK